MRNFRILRDWADAGYFETDSLRQLRDDVAAAIRAGRLVAICGPVGSGKTMMMNRLQHDIAAEKDIIVARSLSVDKQRVTLRNLIMALFLDISGDPHLKAPAQPERRERLLQEMVRKVRKPVVLFIDEAHDIHGHTLNGLKRLMELIAAGEGKLSVVLVGHPRLQNDLRRATMEEIGNRTSKFDFVALGGQRREFLHWLLETCLDEGANPDNVIVPDAQNFLVERLSTPLQFAEHLDRAFTDAFHLGAEKVTREIAENTVSAGFDDLDAKLARIGYTPKALAERFDAHPSEIRRFLSGRLDPERTAELGSALRNAGIPT
ncbi:MAG: AAA family ATPase [Chloroflexota bacterium]|nr:AAA family ATPase [Chloroflexota bacterium]